MAGNPSDLSNRITSVEKNLARIAGSARLAASITFIFALALIGLSIFYYVKLLPQLEPVFEPKELISMVEGKLDLDNKLSSYVKDAENMLIKEAPELAKKASGALVERMPEGRAQIEKMALDKADDVFNHGMEEVQKHVKTFVKMHRKEFSDGVKEMGKSPESAQKFIQSMQPALEAELGVELKLLAGDFLGALVVMNENLVRLREGKGLNPHEATLRQILLLARRKQMEQAMPGQKVGGGKDTAVGSK